MCNQRDPMQRLTQQHLQSNRKMSRTFIGFYTGISLVTTISSFGVIQLITQPAWANSEINVQSSQLTVKIPRIESALPAIPETLAQTSVIYVDPNTGVDSGASAGSQTGPYRSITYAMQKAEPGTVIQLNPGTYSQETGEAFPILIKSGVTLQGDISTNGENIAIVGGGNFVSPTFARQNATFRTGENSQIIGVTITNPNTRGTAIWIESSNPTIQNSAFINSKRDGIFISAEGNPKIISNIFFQNEGNGISIARSGAGEIRNNLFQNTGFGISINDEAAPLIIENKIIENRDGLVVSHQAKPVLRNNLIENNARDGIVAISQAQPDLGTSTSPGQNIIRSNGRHDVYNATRGYTLTAVGNELDQTRISGALQF